MISGVYVANLTPFGPGGEIDAHAYLSHVSWLAERGVQGVVPFGTNGEGPSVSLTEKLHILEALFAANLPIQIIPAVMEGNLPASRELVRRVNDLPAAAVLILPPYYLKPVSTEGLRRFFEPLIEASRHQVMLYHIPKYAVPLPAELAAELAIWGVKDSGGEAGYAEGILAAGKGVLIGTEDDLWSRLSLGAQGLISALANVIPERIIEMRQLHQAGDEQPGRALSAQLQRVRAMTKSYAAPAVLKKLAEARHGIPLGSVRPPLLPAPEDYDPRPILTEAGVE